MTVAEQLTKIYYNEEKWHKTRMNYREAIEYHKERYENGDIQVYLENGEVLGYYQRVFVFNACFLENVWIRKDHRFGRVYKALKKKFFETMPKHITVIIGEKQKLGGKIMKARIRRN